MKCCTRQFVILHYLEKQGVRAVDSSLLAQFTTELISLDTTSGQSTLKLTYFKQILHRKLKQCIKSMLVKMWYYSTPYSVHCKDTYLKVLQTFLTLIFTALGVVDLQKSRSCSVLWNFITVLLLRATVNSANRARTLEYPCRLLGIKSVSRRGLCFIEYKLCLMFDVK